MLNKIIEYGLYLLVFLLPIETRWIIKAGQLNGGYFEYGTYSLYATDILLIIILFLFIIRWLLERRISNFELRITNLMQNAKYKIQNLLIFGLVLAAAVSTLFAADKLLALYKFGWLALGVGLFWLITGVGYNKPKLIYAMLAGAFLQAGLGIWQFLSQAAFANKWLGLASHNAADLGTAVVEAVGADGIGERWLRAYGGLDHPNILGGVLAIGIIFTVYQIVIHEKSFGITNYELPPFAKVSGDKRITDKIRKAILWTFLATFITALFFSFSRSAWLALAAGLAVMIFLAVAGGNLKSQKGLAGTILAMGILSFILFSQYQNLIVARLNGEGRLEIKSNFERLASYQESQQIIKSHWLAGVGPGNYTLALRQDLKPREQSYNYQPAHNVFLLVFSEIGIFGLLFFIGVIIFAFARFPGSSPGLKARNDKINPPNPLNTSPQPSPSKGEGENQEGKYNPPHPPLQGGQYKSP